MNSSNQQSGTGLGPAGASRWARRLCGGLAILGMAAPLTVNAGAVCDGRLYLTQNNPTDLNVVSTDTSPLTFVQVGGSAAVSYNATGYNPVDDMLYAMQTSDPGMGTLLRIDQTDGTVTSLGLVPSLPVGTGFNSGTIGPDGSYYIKPVGATGVIYRINLADSPLTFQTITLSDSFTASDLAWVGGAAGDLYSVDDGGRVRVIDVTDGSVTSSAGFDNTGGVLGAQFGAVNGLFASANGGGFYKIDLVTSARTLLSGSPASGSNDGANCPDGVIQFPSDLSITKTDGSDTYEPGTSVTYTIVVSNAGPFAASDVTVSDPLPAGITTASWTCTPAGSASCTANGTGGINDGAVSIPVNGSVTYELVLDVPADFTGQLINTATVTPGPDTVDPMPSDNTATDVNEPLAGALLSDLSITKTDGSGTYDPGTSVTYTIVVGNAGPDAASGVTVSDPLPAGITTASWTCTAMGGASCTANGTGGIADATVNLPVSASVTYQLTLDVPANFTGQLVNTATVTPGPGTTDPNPGNNSATDVNQERQLTADLSITKTAASTYTPGGTMNYTIVVSNAGPDAANGVTVSDPLPAGISAANWTCAPAGGAACTANGTGGIADSAVNLPASTSVTYQLTLQVPVSFTGTLVNTASVAPPPGVTDPTPANNSAAASSTQAPRAPTMVSVNSPWMLLLSALMLALFAGIWMRKVRN